MYIKWKPVRNYYLVVLVLCHGTQNIQHKLSFTPSLLIMMLLHTSALMIGLRTETQMSIWELEK